MNNQKQAPRYYVPHHLIFYPVMGVLVFACMRQAFMGYENQYIWFVIGICFFSVIALAFMLRQHYALGNQDRIVRLEMRYRYFATTGSRFEPLEKQLTFKQIAALRFASDEEMSDLIEKTVSEKLTPSLIKEKITNWVTDDMRL
ncbi:MAG: hypothetical protein H7329_02340 [Opitutaceae bacterium]|nr:hypothetical protein [Cytophagales bacterium]